ncbi:hypothetical protein HZH66_002809 [Vespula vulgaris]|uniref:Uncharacterized protein n=1 Tax=Vespula vulgaris TaxID=7454 RepID=A0A834NGB6_VESVU|nr:hypothetical protein HZH66_002809 [Vespula vulgaris]
MVEDRVQFRAIVSRPSVRREKERIRFENGSVKSSKSLPNAIEGEFFGVSRSNSSADDVRSILGFLQQPIYPSIPFHFLRLLSPLLWDTMRPSSSMVSRTLEIWLQAERPRDREHLTMSGWNET